VASATAGLVIASKTVATHCASQPAVNAVIGAVSQCALCTSQLVACAKVCAATARAPDCQRQVAEAARHVSGQVDAVLRTARAHCHSEPPLAHLAASARHVADAVAQLLAALEGFSAEQLVAPHAQQCQAQDEHVERIFRHVLLLCVSSSFLLFTHLNPLFYPPLKIIFLDFFFDESYEIV
jgi:hypothetical protein